ncbi:CheR family methyltransferase [Myxococcus qinghaiensis]|uniref:CheR family methyltransferase n=1 Tax=Myxococcus qinghaiensis TaxID=2906758 RepID=UPI0020A7DA4E|nr:CheR family methyltransferase [Myxococcus qinghaiensis]MCP3169493.1 methyltransferase domain-containing protein [Myxococcus qinghaiensis]
MSLSGPQIRRLDDRLAERCRGLTPHQYLAFLKSPSGAAELEGLISAVVVNKTDLFRDEVQLTDFRERVLSPLVARAGGRPLRIWSAGCSTGEEVATLLILLAESGASPGSTVLGTDISEAALRRASALCFTTEQLRRVPAGPRERYFVPRGSKLSLVSALRERASFQVHNLMDVPYPRPMGAGCFDVIFCRNVLIYFTVESFHRTVATLADSLVPGGTLVLSASEPLLQVPPTLRVARTEAAFFHVRVDVSEGAQGTPRPGKDGTASSVATSVTSSASVRSAEGGARSTSRESSAGVGASREPPTSSGVDRKLAVGANREASTPIGAGHASTPGANSALPPPSGAGREQSSPLDAGRASASGASREPSIPTDTDRGSALPSPSSAEADLLFACVLDGAAAGASDAVAERDLRRCLSLDPDHAAARYLLGLLLEQCRRPLEAAAEYRRALVSLEEGRARPVPFFLNPGRLRVACAHAAGRLSPPSSRR